MSMAILHWSTSLRAWSKIWLVVRLIRIMPCARWALFHSSSWVHVSNSCSHCHARAVHIPSDCMLGDGKSNKTLGFIGFDCWDRRNAKWHLLEGGGDLSCVGDVGWMGRLRLSLNGGRVVGGCLGFVGSVGASIARHRQSVGFKARSGGRSWGSQREMGHSVSSNVPYISCYWPNWEVGADSWAHVLLSCDKVWEGQCETLDGCSTVWEVGDGN